MIFRNFCEAVLTLSGVLFLIITLLDDLNFEVGRSQLTFLLMLVASSDTLPLDMTYLFFKVRKPNSYLFAWFCNQIMNDP